MAHGIKKSDETKWLPLLLRFIEELRIQSKEVTQEDERGSKMDLWGSQRMALNELCIGMEKGIREFLCLKSRQLGISTIFLAVAIFWLAVFKGTTGALVTDTEGTRDSFRETLKRYINSFPPGFAGSGLKIVRENRNFLLLSNGSRLNYLVAGVSKNKDHWGESVGYSFCLCTEASKYGSAKGIQNFREALAEQNPDRLFIYESTANGPNHYKAMWEDFGKDPYTKHRMFIGWWAKEFNTIPRSDPRFDAYGIDRPDQIERAKMEAVAERYGVVVTMEQLAWYRERQTTVIADAQSLDQNQPWLPEDAFVIQGFSFFPMKLIEGDLDRIYGDNKFEQDGPVNFSGYRFIVGNDFQAAVMEPVDNVDDATLRVWEEPVDGADYVVGCDPAYGRNDWKDRSVISVWRCFADKLVQVAEFADSDVESRQCAWILAYICGAYGQGTSRVVVNIELYGPGRVVFNELDNLRSRMRAEIYSARSAELGWDDFLSNATWYLYHRYDSMGGGYAPAFETTTKTKIEIMNQIRDNYYIRLMVVNSAPMLLEMCNVIQDGSHIGAPEGAGESNKDDRVFAGALANRSWIDQVRNRLITEGKTYDAVMNEESGDTGVYGKIVNRRVMDFLRNAAEAEINPNTTPAWLRDRGFV